VDSIDSTRLRRIFDLLGRAIRGPVEFHIAGSSPTLIMGLTARPTGVIDFVDEIPAEVRNQRIPQGGTNRQRRSLGCFPVREGFPKADNPCSARTHDIRLA
jgi:hypothetical protein